MRRGNTFRATRFVDDAARRVLATGARIVGCTSTCEQHVASLALLRRIRALAPAVVTMMGGANCAFVIAHPRGPACGEPWPRSTG